MNDLTTSGTPSSSSPSSLLWRGGVSTPCASLTLGQVGEGRVAGGCRAAGRRAGASSTQGHAEQRGELEGQRHWHHPSQHAVGQRERRRRAQQTAAARHGDLSGRALERLVKTEELK